MLGPEVSARLLYSSICRYPSIFYSLMHKHFWEGNVTLTALQVQLQQAALPAPASQKPENPSSNTQLSRPRSRETAGTEQKPQQSPRKVSRLLTAPLTAANYKDKFLGLNESEKEEHVRALERYPLNVHWDWFLTIVEKSSAGKNRATEEKGQRPSSNLGPTLYRGVSATSYLSQSRSFISNRPLVPGMGVPLSSSHLRPMPRHREIEAATYFHFRLANLCSC